MTLICHLTTREAWVQAVWAEELRAESLAIEGFIHTSTPEQVVATANRYYAGRSDLVLLSIDTDRLTSDLRWEPAASVGEEFPHIYGPLNLAAVTQALEFKPGRDGQTFEALPPGLDHERYTDSLWLRAENHDGTAHWAHPALRHEVAEGRIVTRTGMSTIVAREKGAFTSNWFTRGHYWPDRWYNVIRLQNPNGSLDGYYCNIARPLPFDGRTVRYADMQLDVRVFANADGTLSWRVLDEDEFEVARQKYGYDEEIVRRCYGAVDECIAAVKAREFPFDS
jgi:uncharacterized protein (DUF952 family)/protein associated with RNAse G/E